MDPQSKNLNILWLEIKFLDFGEEPGLLRRSCSEMQAQRRGDAELAQRKFCAGGVRTIDRWLRDLGGGDRSHEEVMGAGELRERGNSEKGTLI